MADRNKQGMPTYNLDIDFPMLWAVSKAVDEAEKLGQSGSVGPLHREVDRAMNELWTVRNNLDLTKDKG